MDYSIKLSNGQVLRGIIMSPGEKLRAVIILIHGHGEHIRRYDHLLEFFKARDIGFTGVDLPGHGRSEGKRGHIKSFGLLYEMTDIIINECRKTFPDSPLILYGHSLGGLIVLDYLLQRTPKIKAAVVTSPLIRLSYKPDGIKILLASVVKYILPGLTQASGLAISHLSHDPDEVNKYKNDPLVHDQCSVSLFNGFINAGKRCLKDAAKLSVPVLLVHGSDDRITSPDASREFASATPLADLKIWDKGFHELHNDTFRSEVLSYIGTWIDTKLENKSE